MRTTLITIVMIGSLLIAGSLTEAAEASGDVDIVVLGGTDVVSADVLDHLAACTNGTVTRIAGSDRYATAAATSRAAFDSATIVYVSVGTSFPEAVAAGPIAALRDAPLLLTRANSLPGVTRAEIERLGASRVIILGGTGAVSSSVEQALRSEYSVTRIAGKDRYSTAAAISASYFEPGSVSVAYVARGDLFPDALAAGPAAVANDGPILLTARNSLPSATAAELQRLAPSKIVILGGSNAVSVGVEKTLGAFTSGSVSRIAGSNRYDTAAKTSTKLPAGSQSLYLATGEDFPDALAGVPLADTNPVLLVTQQTVPTQTASRIAAVTGKSCAPLVPLSSLASAPSGTGTSRSGVLWFADHESRDVSKWDGVTTSGDGDARVSTDGAHTGAYGVELKANGIAGIRMRVQDLGPDPVNLPTDAYYSVWYKVPFGGMTDNIFQFKQAEVDKWGSNGEPTHQTRRMLSKVSLEWDGQAYDVAYRTRIRQANGEWSSGNTDTLARANVNLPLNEWFHLEMRYVWGMDGTGRSTLWVDGVQVWDLESISTEANNLQYIYEPRQWAVNHYLSKSNDSSRTTWIYIDDAAISTTRIGP